MRALSSIAFVCLLSGGAAGLALGATTTVVPPVGEPPELPGGGEVAVYSTIDGQAQRLDPGDRGGPDSPFPQRAIRMTVQGDVPLACSAPASCQIAGAADPELVAAALRLASNMATADRPYPLAITLSFRILSFPPSIPQRAPQACPGPGHSRSDNRFLRDELRLTGRCISAARPPR